MQIYDFSEGMPRGISLNMKVEPFSTFSKEPLPWFFYFSSFTDTAFFHESGTPNQLRFHKPQTSWKPNPQVPHAFSEQTELNQKVQIYWI